MESIKKQYNDRSAYQGETILGKDLTLSTDIWESGLNNNMLVLGSSGAGKTRNVVKPNLMQMHGSYVVLDTKGQLHKEVASPAQFHEIPLPPISPSLRQHCIKPSSMAILTLTFLRRSKAFLKKKAVANI